MSAHKPWRKYQGGGRHYLDHESSKHCGRCLERSEYAGRDWRYCSSCRVHFFLDRCPCGCGMTYASPYYVHPSVYCSCTVPWTKVEPKRGGCCLGTCRHEYHDRRSFSPRWRPGLLEGEREGRPLIDVLLEASPAGLRPA